MALAIIAALAIATTGNSGIAAESPSPIADAARTLLARFDEAQRTTVLHDLDAAERRDWSNLPAGVLRVPRAGVRMGDLDEDRRAAVLAFLSAALSDEGFAKVRQIVRADGILSAAPRAARLGWTEDNYWFAIFGVPSANGTWAWHFGGHHLAVNATMDGDRMYLTPTFLGVEPAMYEDNGTTYAPMAKELEGGLALMSALEPARQAVTLVENRPREVYAGPGRDDVSPPEEGAIVGDWTPDQQALLLDLANRWIGLMPERFATRRLREVAAALDETRFAWNGPTDGSGRIYYRVQGPGLLIEFSTQGDLGDSAGHYHSIYRNPSNEYGGVTPDSR